MGSDIVPVVSYGKYIVPRVGSDSEAVGMITDLWHCQPINGIGATMGHTQDVSLFFNSK